MIVLSSDARSAQQIHPLLHNPLLRTFQKVKQMAEQAENEMECVIEPESDVLKGFKRVASGELEICGIEHKDGGYDNKKSHDPSEKGEENHDRNDDCYNKYNRMANEVGNCFFHNNSIC